MRICPVVGPTTSQLTYAIVPPNGYKQVCSEEELELTLSLGGGTRRQAAGLNNSAVRAAVRADIADTLGVEAAEVRITSFRVTEQADGTRRVRVRFVVSASQEERERIQRGRYSRTTAASGATVQSETVVVREEGATQAPQQAATVAIVAITATVAFVAIAAAAIVVLGRRRPAPEVGGGGAPASAHPAAAHPGVVIEVAPCTEDPASRDLAEVGAGNPASCELAE
jgi:hypothetical protein